MRLLHVYAGPFPSHQGTQVYLTGLLGALARRGHQVALRCWHAGSGAEPAGVDIRRLAPIPGGDGLVSGPSLTRIPHAAQLLAALRHDLRDGWDLVHAHHVEATWLAASLGARPLLHHAHTALAEELPTYGGGALAGLAGAAVDWSLAAACDGAVALSERGAGRLRRLGVRSVLVAPPGVDVHALSGDAARAREAHDLGDRDWVLYTGNLDGYQDLDVLLDALALGDWPLLIVTGSPTTALDVAIRDRRVAPERCRIVHSTDFSVTRDAMAAAAVGVVPRAVCAGFPMKLLNLLGAGVPTVVVDGAVEALPGTVAVPPQDPAAMAAELAALLADAPRRQVLGAAGRAAIVRDFSWDSHAAAVEAEGAALLARVTAWARRT